MGRRLGAVAIVAALATIGAACGGGSKSGSGGEADKVAKIGFIGPLTGSLGAFGTGMKNSVQLAIDQANQKGIVKGWKLELAAEDDAADAKQGAAAAQKLASDPDVVAVIGTLNSSVAQAVQPVLDQASIAMVSPANTNPTLTMGQDWATKPVRPHANYTRVVATDREQGQFAAQLAFTTLKKKKAVAIHDKKTYGQGLATIFSEQFKKAGGTVEETLEINPGEGDYKAAITRAKSKSPDIIYYGGEFPEAGVICKNMAELGLKAPDVVLMGGDGIVDKKFVEICGQDNAQGHFATLVGASASLLPEAKQFVDDYKAKFNKEDFSAFGPPSYDSANIIIQALSKTLTADSKIETATRQDIIKAIQGITYKGVLGATSFNQFGDTTNKLLTEMKVEGDDFKGIEAKRLS